MATGTSRLDDPEYVNWLRTTLSMMHMKEGLEEFVDNQVIQFHKELLTSIGPASQPCHCTSADIKKNYNKKTWYMTCQGCNEWLQKVIHNHRNAPFPIMSPANTELQSWRTKPWETTKLYLPYGCTTDQCAKDMDIQGMLTLFINCQQFSSGKHISRPDLLDKLLRIRNGTLHSGNFKLSEADTQNNLEAILDFLEGITGLNDSEKESLLAATDSVKQLKTSAIKVIMNEELELRALRQQHIALEREVRDLRSQGDSIQNKLGSQDTELKTQTEALKESQAALKSFDEFLQQHHLDITHFSKRLADVDRKLNKVVEDVLKLQPKPDTPADEVNVWEKTCEDLKQHLLGIYTKRKFWKDPVTSEEAHLAQMYVQPCAKRAREINEQGRMVEVHQQKSKTLTYDMIFRSKNGLCENIYLTGEAGAGKTTFCDQLVLSWCNALPHSIQHKDLLSFQFLFYINLRNCETLYNVEDMIREQLLFNAPAHLKSALCKILNTKKCLTVLDGLDEWSCPNDVKKFPDINQHIPGRNTGNKACVFLTTTRNWKYTVIALKNKDVDKHVEMGGIDEHSSEKLAQRMLSYLNRNSETNKTVADFLTDVHNKKLCAFLTVPVLLIQLINLWFFGKDFGNSQLQLYCSILDLLFECSKKNLKPLSTNEAKPKQLPECFGTKDYCTKYAELLLSLAQFAYKSLFNKHKEEALVFKSSRMEVYGLSPADIELCLHCGILSQCKDYDNYTGNYKKYSFFHKKIQECLAAVFIVTSDNVEDILNEVKQLCNSVETMLEMNQVWLFVAGMEPDISKELFVHLVNVFSDDESHRETLGPDYDYDGLIDDIQRCLSDCVLEGINNGLTYENVCLKEVHIDEGNITDVERLCCCIDTSKVNALHIETDDIDPAKLAAITDQFQQCSSLKKLFLDDLSTSTSLIPDSLVAALVGNNCDSLISLYLSTTITATEPLVTAICNSKSLMALQLSRIKLTHKHKQQILQNLSATIRQLDLYGLHCTDHDKACRASIDLSAMNQLQKLTLRHYMRVDNLQNLSHDVEEVELWGVILSAASLLDFALGISQTGRKRAVVLERVTLEPKEECGGLKGDLRRCSGLKLTHFRNLGKDNTWIIKFHTSSQ